MVQLIFVTVKTKFGTYICVIGEVQDIDCSLPPLYVFVCSQPNFLFPFIDWLEGYLADSINLISIAAASAREAVSRGLSVESDLPLIIPFPTAQHKAGMAYSDISSKSL